MKLFMCFFIEQMRRIFTRSFIFLFLPIFYAKAFNSKSTFYTLKKCWVRDKEIQIIKPSRLYKVYIYWFFPLKPAKGLMIKAMYVWLKQAATWLMPPEHWPRLYCLFRQKQRKFESISFNHIYEVNAFL